MFGFIQTLFGTTPAKDAAEKPRAGGRANPFPPPEAKRIPGEAVAIHVERMKREARRTNNRAMLRQAESIEARFGRR